MLELEEIFAARTAKNPLPLAVPTLPMRSLFSSGRYSRVLPVRSQHRVQVERSVFAGPSHHGVCVCVYLTSGGHVLKTRVLESPLSGKRRRGEA